MIYIYIYIYKERERERERERSFYAAQTRRELETDEELPAGMWTAGALARPYVEGLQKIL